VNVVVPRRFGRTVAAVFGADGRRWLADLPAVADAVLRDWGLELIGCFDLSLNWVAEVRCADGSPAVLKLGVPQAGHLADEAAALELFGGRGAVDLLDRDDARGALLLERARPGIPLSALGPADDAEATAAFIGMVRRLHRPAPPDVALPELTARGEAFAAVQGSGVLPEHLVHRAGRLFEELCASATDRVVLHGDLHHDNILAADREPWLAIDPHGVVGDPGYEVGALLYNPDPSRRDDARRLLPSLG
jgi:streptomycin 6-kinase